MPLGRKSRARLALAVRATGTPLPGMAAGVRDADRLKLVCLRAPGAGAALR
jgi:hypothetical protein